MVEYFPDIVDFKFTATVEKDFDEIADGKMNWQTMLEGFYGDFHRNIEEIQGSSVVSFTTGARDLGLDPRTGKKVSARLGKYGAYAQIGESTDDEKPQYANLRDGMLIETISLADALNLFSLPREVGFFEDQAMTIGIGKFGPYVKHDGKYVSLTKEDDPYTITAERTTELIQQKRVESVSEALGEYEGTLVATGKGRFGPYVKHNDKYISIPRNESLATLSLDRAIELILAKRQAEANKYIKEFPENPAVKIVNGQYGPYLAVGKRNVKIPKETDPATLTLEQCLELAGGEPTPARSDGSGKAAAKKPAGKSATTKTPAKKATAKTATAKAPVKAKPAAAKKPAAKKVLAGK